MAIKAGLNLFSIRPIKNIFLIQTRLILHPVGNGTVVRIGLMRALRVRQNKGVLAVLVLEEIINPLLLHQPAGEIEIRLAILHAIIPFAELAG